MNDVAQLGTYAIVVTLMLVSLLAVLYYHVELKEQPKRSRYITEEYRRYVLWRDNGKCRMCGATDNLAVDHIMPFVRGGSNELTNLQILCRACNSAKGARI